MMERVFLGWDRPFLTEATAWLLERRDELPGILLVTPTAQGGRRLREALAEAGGALLSPKVATPGSFLQAYDTQAAPDWVEQVAWVEVFENISDWSDYEALFPEPPGGDGDWSGGLAREMVALRRTLQENGLLLASAARLLRESVEAERWQALARLEELVERKLRSWNEKSRSRLLAGGLEEPAGISHIVLAGVAEMPPLLERALATWNIPTTVLVGAPPAESENFSPAGRPESSWTERPLPHPSGGLRVAADPRQQAAEALRLIAEEGRASDEIALGSADIEAGEELARTFTREGWPAFHPAAPMVEGGLARWFRCWCGWLADPELRTLADLLALPETSALIGGKRAQKSKTLAQLRDRWMIVRTTDLRRRMETEAFRNDVEKEAAEELMKAADTLESWRGGFSSGDFTGTLHRMLDKFSARSFETAAAMEEWLAQAVPLMARVKRGPRFWIELMLSETPDPPPQPPEGRVLDVQGWLELFHEPGGHLVLCGMNEGRVPARMGGEPWLGEASRGRLGLIRDVDRAARDAFLYQAMIEARREGGRVDVICGKSGNSGEPLLPSRLLLATGRDELPRRVSLLFREVEPPEAGMRWHADWRWKPRAVDPPARLNATSLGDWLKCPFRYYLKHAVGMRSSETGRAEWNARDFGNVAHEVLENWGLDPQARNSENAEVIHAWFSNELDRVTAVWFGKNPPLAVRIQVEALRQRLLWLARVQAQHHADGWEVVEVEQKVELNLGGAVIVTRIDRIDRHRETGRLRVLDYKTGKVEGVDKAHRKKISASTTLPAHLTENCPAIHAGEEKGKSASFLWHNLQLPLYASALVRNGEPLPTPCYFKLGATEADVAILEWQDFDDADLTAADACASWVAGQIGAGVFWPPAEKVAYDDYAVLAAGRSFDEMFEPV
jgi:ATP-dependent helicase/nuclease subunit B